jgi:hypothetical protein
VAVVQISRIQVRRGQANQGSGVPQLAGGEFGWAVDSQELFIGNGAVSEGAPQVGNTKILTENTDLFTLAETYAYRPGNIETTVGGSELKRTLQARLDDVVSVRGFGCYGDDSDVTNQLQKALYELYLNPTNKTNPQSRMILNVEPGIYNITNTVYLPPYVTMIGAGKDKTVFRKTGDFTMFETVDDNTVYQRDLDTVILSGHSADPSISDSASQSKGIYLENMSFETETNNGTLLMLNSTKDSFFQNLKFLGPKLSGEASTSVAVDIRSKSNAVDSKQLKFTECEFVGMGVFVLSNHNLNTSYFENCVFDKAIQAFKWGTDMAIGQTPPSHNWITQCYFEDIDEHAINIAQGTRNIISKNYYGKSVGNNGGSASEAAFSVVKFGENGNSSIDEVFDRTYNLSINQEYIVTEPYVADVEGPVFQNYGTTETVQVPTQSTDVVLFRLSAEATKTYVIEYVYTSTQTGRNFNRSGELTVMVNRTTNTTLVTDDYSITGNDTVQESLRFDADIVELGTSHACRVLYQNQLDQGTLTYRINTKS